MINHLEIENVKKLKFVQLDQEKLGDVVVVEGANAQGKTSIMDAIRMAIGGERNIPENPIREGEENATITLKTTDDYKIERRIGYAGKGRDKKNLKTELRIWDKTGNIVSKPQTFLNELLGKAIVRPLEIVNAKGVERRETLREALAIDFSGIDMEIGRLSEERLELGREAKLVEGQLLEYRDVLESFGAERTADEVLAEISEIDQLIKEEMDAKEVSRQKRSEIDRASESLIRMKREMRRTEARMEEITETLNKLNTEMVDSQRKAERLDSEILARTQGIAEMEKRICQGMVVPQEKLTKKEELKKELREINERQRELARFEQKNRLKQKHAELKEDYALRTQKIKDKEEEKKQVLRETKFPLEGMSFGDNDITMGGIEFSQCSMSEKIRASVAINSLINSKMRIMVLEDGSALDDRSMEELVKMAREKNFQIFVEKVRQSGYSNCLIIQDGRVE